MSILDFSEFKKVFESQYKEVELPNITGIDNLNKFLLDNKDGYMVDPYDDGSLYYIVDVNAEGIETDKKSFIKWESVYFGKDGLMITCDDGYFYFNLSEEEKLVHPYNKHLEIKADMEDAFRDADEDETIPEL